MPDNKAFKIVGLIASVVVVLSVIVGSALWVSQELAQLTVRTATNSNAINLLSKDHVRMDNSISQNSTILNQHARLLVILEQHSAQLEVLTKFMLRGDRYTQAMGEAHEKRTTKIEKWIANAPPDWFEDQFRIVVRKIDELVSIVIKNREEITLLKHEIMGIDKGRRTQNDKE